MAIAFSFNYKLGLIEPLTETVFGQLFIVAFCIRYFRLLINTAAYCWYQPIPIPENPNFSFEDVTVILPTISTDLKELRKTIQSILACSPSQVLLVTPIHKYDIKKLCKSINAKNLKLLTTQVESKRLQVCEAIPHVKTLITILVDDDVIWPTTILPWVLAPFENRRIGAVGTSQRVRRIEIGTPAEWLYNYLGAGYIERRNFEILATHVIDGGTSCMSGRTCAIRSRILQDHLFLDGYSHETWGRKLLDADDDNFIYRWLLSKDWRTWVQCNRECEIETTLENNVTFLYQCGRWARSNWRSNWTSLTKGYVFKHPWCLYALHFTMLINFALVIDLLLVWLCFQSTLSFDRLPRTCYRATFCIWLLTTKIIKLLGLYKRNIWDICFFPVSFFFAYYHSFIKGYALFTLDKAGVVESCLARAALDYVEELCQRLGLQSMPPIENAIK